MPVAPEFIPLTKKHEMFAISSWRDSPGHKPEPQPGGSLDSLRNKPSSGAAVAGALSPPLPAAAAPADADAAKSAEGGKRRGHRHRKRENAAAAAAAAAVVEVEDFLVHVRLPNATSKQTLIFEVQTHNTPLRVVDVGQDRVIAQRRATETTATTADCAAVPPSPTPAPISGPSGVKPSSKPLANTAQNQLTQPLALSPFRTPAVHGRADMEMDMGLPPAMALPPSQVGAAGTSARARAAVADGHTTATAPATAAALTTNTTVMSDDYQVSFLFAEEEEADKTVTLVQKRWPNAVVTKVSRPRGTLNASLVLKGLPGLGKTELLLDELMLLPHKPSYVRLHRGDRGVFKSVVFVKYATREAAEDCKLRLERYHLGNRPLKVEFKKKAAKVAEVEAEDSAAPGSLQQLVRDLRVSSANEGFTYQRSDLSKEELKMLKQLCQSYNLYFDMTDTKVTVRRALGRHRPGAPTSGSPSPAMRPQSTPAWVMPTPAGLVPRDFKGLRHWRDVRNQQQEVQSQQIGIIRPLGPDDGKAAFSAGRGRPL